VARLLVSVKDRAEAAMAVAAGADLIDAKDPARGALGGLPVAEVRAIHAAVAGRAPTSAVVGDEEDADILLQGARALADTGVSFVKLGLAGRMASAEAIRSLGERLPRRIAVVAVLFADAPPSKALVPVLAHCGFAGAMVDTQLKTGRRLPDLWSIEQMSEFVRTCRGEGLMCGLAGSLRIGDIALLAPLGPDYLGFRGGLCTGSDRGGALDASRIAEAARAMAKPLTADGAPV
jgi:(5-formylfuran-3-yl)methyl phosphate synthase